jgi:chromate transporter
MTSLAPAPTHLQLFLGFTRVGLLAFGGAAALARATVVEQRRWMTERDFAEMLAVGQVLPGPNVGNTAVMLGRRFHGFSGALAASAGFYAVPLLLLTGLLLLHGSFGSEPRVAAFMQGIAAAAAGMVIGTALKMAQNLRPALPILAVGIAALLGAAVLRLPLPVIVLGLAPFGIAAAWWGDRRPSKPAR